MNKNLIPQLFNWLKNITTETGEFCLSVKNKPTLMSNCFGLSLLVLVKKNTDNVSVYQDKLCQKILVYYDKNQDVYNDPLLKQEEILSPLHTYDYLVEQTSYFCRHILYLLGYKVPFNPEAKQEIYNPDWVTKYLSDLDWSDPWLESNKAMFLLDRLTFNSLYKKRKINYLPSLNAAFDYFDNSIDPKTGLWGTDKNSGLMRGVAGSYHIIPYYLFFKRPIPFVKEMVKSVLRLENPEGLFYPIAGGCACVDTDAIGILSLLYHLVPYYHQEIKAILARSRELILNLQSSGGGFVESGASSSQRLSGVDNNSGDLLNQIWTSGTSMKYSSWNAMEYDTDKPDLWSTYFRLLSIAYCDTILQTEHLKQWNFESIPGLAFSPIIQNNITNMG